MLTYGIVAGLERLCMPVLFKEISVDLNLDMVSLGTIWGMDPLAGIFVGLIGGLIADRFGIKRSLTVICLLAGVFSAVRGLTTSFWTMGASMFLFGAMAAMTPSIVPKVAAVWFDRRRLGLANALINLSWALFAMVATMTSATILSPWLGNWRNVIFLLSVPIIIVGLLWWFTGRDPAKQEPQTAPTTKIPFKQALSHVLRVREIWVLGLISMMLWGANMGFLGYLPLYLRDIGWSTASADGVVTAFNGASMLGMVPMVLLASRLRLQKGMLFFCMVTTLVFMGLVPLVNGPTLWTITLLANFLRSCAFPITNVLIFDVKGIGSTYGGTATGLVSSIGMIGGFAAPPLGNSLHSISPEAPFFFWAGLAALSLPMFIFLRTRKETGEYIPEV
jgi:NNP family nitrate/nitrite transporter-like MFS transporter